MSNRAVKDFKMDRNVSEAVTGLNIDKRAFNWRIENFDLVRKRASFIDSQQAIIYAGESINLETEWMFSLRELTARKDGGKEKFWIGFYLTLLKVPRRCKAIMASMKMNIRDGNGSTYFNRVMSNPSFINWISGNQLLSLGWGQVIPRDAAVELLPLQNGCLVMEIELTLFDSKPTAHLVPKKVHSSTSLSVQESFKIKFTDLQRDLQNLLISSSEGRDTETKIISKDKKEFPVNRGILSARSPVFASMFQSKMKESQSGVIRIRDLSSKTVEVLLQFIYTGKFDKEWSRTDVIVEFVYAAEKYQLLDLLEFLNEILGSVCSKETAGKLYNLAKKMSMKKAEKELFQYMKKNISSMEDMAAYFNDSLSLILL